MGLDYSGAMTTEKKTETKPEETPTDLPGPTSEEARRILHTFAHGTRKEIAEICGCSDDPSQD